MSSSSQHCICARSSRSPGRLLFRRRMQCPSSAHAVGSSDGAAGALSSPWATGQGSPQVVAGTPRLPTIPGSCEARAERICVEDAQDPAGAAAREEARLEQASALCVMETALPDVARAASPGASGVARVAAAAASRDRDRSPSPTGGGASSGDWNGPWQSAGAGWQSGTTWPKQEEEEDRDEQAAGAAWSCRETWRSTRGSGSWEGWR